MPLRSSRPSLLARSLTSLDGSRTRGRARMRPSWASRRSATCSSTCRSTIATTSDARPVAELAIGEEATVAVTVKNCRVRPTRRRRLTILECQVADDTGPAEGGLVQPGLSRRPAHGGGAPDAARKARRRPWRRRRSGWPRMSASGVRRGTARPPHDGTGARLSGHGGPVGAPDPRAGVGRCAAWSAHASSRSARLRAQARRLAGKAR